MSEHRSLKDIQADRDELESKIEPIRSEMLDLGERDSLDEGKQERYEKLRRSLENYLEEDKRLRKEWGDAVIRGVEDGRFGTAPGDDRGPQTSTASRSTSPGPTIKRHRGDPWAGRTGGPLTESPDELRGRALTAVERSDDAPDAGRERVTRILEYGDPQGAAARWAIASSDPAYSRAFWKLLADPTRGPATLTEDERRAVQVESEARAMTIGTDTSGGHLTVPFQLDPTLVLSGDGSIEPMRQVARIETISGTETWKGVTTTGITASWDAEGEEVSDDTPTLAEQQISVHNGRAFVPFSFEFGQDVGGAQQQLMGALADAKAQHEATAFTTGSGSGQPQGLITALTASETVSTASATTFASEDVYALLEALPARFRGRAEWLAPLPILNEARQFETTNGARLFPELSSADPRLLSRRLHENSEMDSDSSTSGNNILAVGDFRHYVIVDRLGTTVELVPHLFGGSQRPTGERGLLLHWRVGADVLVANAFRRLQVSA